MVAGTLLALAGLTAALLTAVFIRPDIHRLANALLEPDAWQRFHISDHPEGGFPLEAMSRAAVIAALILAAGGVALLITGTGLWRLLLSGAAGGSAVYLLQMVEPWMAAALPGWVTPVIAVLPILLAALAVLLALAVAPTLNRTRLLGGLATAGAVGGIVAAFDWWRFDLSDRPASMLFLTIYWLAGPLLLSAIVLACALVAGLRRAVRARWQYAVIGLGLAVAAIAGELLVVVPIVTGVWYPDFPLNAGPIIGALLALITLYPILGELPAPADA